MRPITSWQADVSNWHAAMQLPSGGPLTPELLALRIQLIEEEARELDEAAKAKDLVETYDALADLAFVTLGTFDQAGEVASDRYVELLETTRWSGEVRGYFGSQFTISRSGMACLFMEQCLEQGTEFKRWDLLDGVMNGVVHCAGDLGFDLRPIWDEVVASNMSKTGGVVDENGKLQKGPNFRRPEIGRILREMGAKV